MKEKVTTSPEKSADFYQPSANWAYEMYFSQSVWLKRSLLVIVLLTILLLLSLVANVLLIPLKEKVPYLYAFNNATGEVTTLGELQPSTLSTNWQMTRYFLMHYVINRESYDFDNLNYPYQIAWAMSANRVRQDYVASVNSNVATSPYRVYGKTKTITVHVLAISRLSEDTASVRFEKILTDRDTGTQAIAQNEAIVKWQYAPAETTQKMLDRDPLGFKVTYYAVTPVSLDNNAN